MSSELRVKKLRGSGGYVMASVNDEQQMKANLGGPDLFLAPIGRLNSEIITKHFCNTCEKEFEGSPKIEYENPNEEVAENLILAEKGQYICNSCNSTIAEYREFKKQDEVKEIGEAKPIEPTQESPEPTGEQPQPVPEPPQTQPQQVTQAASAENVSSIEGLPVYDENAKQIGTAKQVGVDSNQTVVLLITKNDGSEGSVPWNSVGKVGDIILLGSVSSAPAPQPGKCTNCGFVNNEGSKFCEECGTKLQ
ncbi:MAG: zinc-ribbon domain-containing protein [Nitrososphaeria archaeon]|nr:zinc-ribbon domain-containing protein [Nitrosopumilaceae archaeon]NIP10238.1 zinc-ribbon domain-containing protein [Nitrosopumilaceae archaeon]NIP91612.1 zinc-ribbon domain-containing protein [Nitrososphaeria archaeon]NIS95450.1 zinc-ribbon domain-containing protein [Nitrosopumilaceae archaeon]